MRSVRKEDRRQRLRPAAGLSPRAAQVSPDPGAAAWTQRRPQPPLMCAAVRADARGTSLAQEERQAAHRPAARRPALCLLSETLLRGPGVAGLAEGASSGSQQDALPTVRGTRALRPPASALGLRVPKKRASALPRTRAASLCRGLRDFPPSGLYPRGGRWV